MHVQISFENLSWESKVKAQTFKILRKTSLQRPKKDFLSSTFGLRRSTNRPKYPIKAP